MTHQLSEKRRVKSKEARFPRKSGLSWNRKVVGARGFEPPTPRSRTECSTRLSHAPTGGVSLDDRAIRASATPHPRLTTITQLLDYQILRLERELFHRRQRVVRRQIADAAASPTRSRRARPGNPTDRAAPSRSALLRSRSTARPFGSWRSATDVMWLRFACTVTRKPFGCPFGTLMLRNVRGGSGRCSMRLGQRSPRRAPRG